MTDILNIVFIILLLQLFVPYLRKRVQAARRISALRGIERRRKSRVITMIHRQETVSLLGIPVRRFIDIEDSEQVLRAIRFTPAEMPIDLVLHTPGGLVLAAEQIAQALKRHPGRVTVFVPHYAMSGGTLIALAADEIVMDTDAVLGPVDPQLGSQQAGYYPAASILKALEQPNPNRDDRILILGDVSKKAMDQVYDTVYNLLLKQLSPTRAKELARALSGGRWTHDYPISFEQAREMGLSVTDRMPREIFHLMELYPQARQQRPSVEFIPTPYPPSPPAPAKDQQQ